MENGRRPDHHRNETAAAGQMHQAVLVVIFAIDSMCAISFSIDFLSSSFRSRNCCVVLFLVLPKASVDCLLPWQPHQWRRTILLMELPPCDPNEAGLNPNLLALGTLDLKITSLNPKSISKSSYICE